MKTFVSLPMRLLVVIGAAAASMLDPAPAGIVAAGVAHLPFVFVGLLSGFMSGLLGIGGALVVVPALYLLLPESGVPVAEVPHVAVQLSLIAMTPTALAAAWEHHRRRALEVAWLRRLLPAMLVGAVAGGVLATRLHSLVLSLLFALQCSCFGWSLLRPASASLGWRQRVVSRFGALPPRWAGGAIGAVCSCAGMGGATLSVPYLAAQGVPLLRATATCTALNVGIALGGTSAHALMAGVPLAAMSDRSLIVPAILIGSSGMLAVRAGVAAANAIPLPLFRRILGVVLLAGAASLLIRKAIVGL